MNPIFMFMLIWIISIGISFWMVFYLISNLYKTFANNGYLINVHKMPNTGNGNKLIYMLFIPIVNIGIGFYYGIVFNRDMRVFCAAADLYADPMSNRQKVIYAEKPTFLTYIELMNESDQVKEIDKQYQEISNSLLYRIREINASENKDYGYTIIQKYCSTMSTMDLVSFLYIVKYHCNTEETQELMDCIKAELDKRGILKYV